MRNGSAPALLLLLAVLLTACSKPAPAPVVSPPARSEPAPRPGAPAPKAWQKVLDSGNADLIDTAPDGSGYLFRQHGGSLTYVQHGTWASQTVATRTVNLTLDQRQVSATIADTPYGPRLLGPGPSGEPPRDAALSPDGKSLAVTTDRLWVVDVESKQARRVGTEPEPSPPNSIKHQVWAWATNPAWSEDGQWIHFYSSRLSPGSLTLWRVPAAGGAEELVSRAKNDVYGAGMLPDGRQVQVNNQQILLVPPDGSKPAVVADTVNGSWLIPPDGRWVVTVDMESDRLTCYEMPSGKARAAELPQGSSIAIDRRWRGSLVLGNLRPVRYEGPSYPALVDASRCTVTTFAPPEPARADTHLLGWTSDGKVLARILPTGATPGDSAGVWVLDPAAYQAPAATAPTALISAHLSGPPPTWRQDGQVTGGETAAQPSSIIWLRFDQPPDPAWVKRELTVTGPATVQTHGAGLGIVSIPLAGAKPGDTVRLRMAAPAFDLTVRITQPPTATLEIRRNGAAWEPVSPETPLFVTGPVDLRIRFSTPVDMEKVLTAWRAQIPGRQVTWEDGALVMLGVSQRGSLRLSLPYDLSDATGTRFESLQLPPVYFGAPPRLVAVEAGKDVPVTQVAPEVIEATPQNQTLLFRAYLPRDGGVTVKRQFLDLATLRWTDLPLFESDLRTRNLREAAYHGDRVAGLEEGLWLGKENGYRWAGSLVVKDGKGQEVRRIGGLQSFWPVWFLDGMGWSETAPNQVAWSPDGRQIALTLPWSRTEQHLLVADVQTGALGTLNRELRGGHVAWAPTGQLLWVGGQVVEAATGRLLRDLGANLDHVRWAPDGARVMYTKEAWGAVLLTDVATGATTDLGPGLPAGFDAQGRPLLIRWEESAHRYIYQGI